MQNLAVLKMVRARNHSLWWTKDVPKRTDLWQRSSRKNNNTGIISGMCIVELVYREDKFGGNTSKRWEIKMANSTMGTNSRHCKKKQCQTSEDRPMVSSRLVLWGFLVCVRHSPIPHAFNGIKNFGSRSITWHVIVILFFLFFCRPTCIIRTQKFIFFFRNSHFYQQLICIQNQSYQDVTFKA